MTLSLRGTVGAALATALLVGGAATGVPGGAAAAGPPPVGADGARGSWTVTEEAPGTHRLTWRSPTPLPVTDAAPEMYLAGRPLPRPSLAADGRTLSVVVPADRAPRVADLEVRLSGRVLDATRQPSTRSGPTTYEVPAPGRELEVDPGERGPYRVEVSDYELPGLDYPLFRRPIEVEGHVVLPDLPDGAAPPPLVLFLHGRHQACWSEEDSVDLSRWPCPAGSQPVPSHRGYEYAQRLLASQGYATVSIAANGINAQDWEAADGGAEARGLLVEEHLDHWAEQVAEGGYDVDLDRVVLIGHSRGGEGVNQASMTIPLDAPYRVVGQVLVAPTAFARAVASYVPTVTLLPYCDGDVMDLQGQAYTDRARDVVDDDPALHSSVLVMGANHNFFNTEWTPRISEAPSFDDAHGAGVCRRGTETRLTARQQRAVGKTYLAGAVQLMAGDPAAAEDLLAMFDGSDVEVPSAGGADVRSHAVGLGRELRRPGFEASVDPDAVTHESMTSQLCVGKIRFRRPAFCGNGVSPMSAPHWVETNPWTRGMPTAPAWHLRWEAAGQYAWLDLGAPGTGWDVGGAEALSLRTVVGTGRGPVELRAILRDGSGGETAVDLEGGGRVSPLPGRDPLGKLWAQDLRVPLAGATGVDLTDLRRIALQGLSRDGEVFVLDVATVDGGLPAVPERRLPLLVIEDAEVQEGDGGPTTASLQWTVEGELTEDARFNVRVTDELAERQVTLHRLTVPAGQTSGEIEVRYDADTRDDVDVHPVGLAVFAERGAMPARSTPALRVLDDDPTPAVTIRAVPRSVREGGTATWEVRLAEPVDYYTSVVARVVDGGGRPVTAGDVPTRWLRRHLGEVPPASTPLHRLRPWLGTSVRGTRAVVRIPTRVDGVDEGPETLSLRIRVRGARPMVGPVVRTVTVRD